MEIKIAGLVDESIVDGPGLRYVIFVQGCPHRCVGCHNPQTHDFNGGKIMDTDEICKNIEKSPLVTGITFSGGEPFCQPLPLVQISNKLYSKYNIICFTGYLFEDLLEKAKTNADVLKLLEKIDILVDGKFEIAKKNFELKFKGSENQRVLDCKASVSIGKAVETEW